MEAETIRKIIAHHQGDSGAETLEEYLQRRDLEGGLEMDAASFNHFYLDHLVDRYPEAKLIFSLREPYAWTGSYLKMLQRWYKRFADRGQPLPSWMGDYGRLLFGQFNWHHLASQESLDEHLQNLVEGFLRHWGSANRRILKALPKERGLLVRTRDLSTSLDAIASFVGVPRETLTDQHHVNASPGSSDPLASLDRSWFEERCTFHGGDILPLVRSERPPSDQRK